MRRPFRPLLAVPAALVVALAMLRAPVASLDRSGPPRSAELVDPHSGREAVGAAHVLPVGPTAARPAPGRDWGTGSHRGRPGPAWATDPPAPAATFASSAQSGERSPGRHPALGVRLHVLYCSWLN